MELTYTEGEIKAALEHSLEAGAPGLSADMRKTIVSASLRRLQFERQRALEEAGG